ncbi:MAG: hypothetical protein HY678_11705, partial [Chloroflexi bacterium]|nr:hypothetical protein [Chloroflexota bacterium]
IRRRLFWFTLLAFLLGVSAVPVVTAQAHSPDVSVVIRPGTMDADQPLVRQYVADVRYTDNDPVSGARVSITGRRREGTGETLRLVAFRPGDRPGVYVAEVTFPRYGNWDMTVTVDSSGKGTTTFLEKVDPALPAVGGGAARTFTALGSFRMPETMQVLVRALHALAGVAWFGLSGVILSAHWLLPASLRGRFHGRLARPFLWISAVSFALIFMSGLYTSYYSAPIRPPGVFNIAVMNRLPYGIPYLSMYFMKVGGLVLLVFLAYRMAKALRAIERLTAPSGGAVAVATSHAAVLDEVVVLHRLAMLNAALGVLGVLAIVLLGYFHNLSHLGLIVPS